MATIPSIIDTLADPQMLHSISVHMPIALSVVAVPLTLVAAVFRKRRVLAVVALVFFIVFYCSALYAVNTGEDAEGYVGDLPDAVHALVHDHEELADKVWMFIVPTGLLVLVGAATRKRAGTICLWLSVVGSIATAAWIGRTAHYGGTAVYMHGVGIPRPVAPVEAEVTFDDPRAAHFINVVQPLLRDRCLGCHQNSPGGSAAGGLDQTSIAGMLRGGQAGPAIVPGDPDASPLFTRLTEQEGMQPMPPNPPLLTESERAAIARWIRDGAVWPES